MTVKDVRYCSLCALNKEKVKATHTLYGVYFCSECYSHEIGRPGAELHEEVKYKVGEDEYK